MVQRKVFWCIFFTTVYLCGADSFAQTGPGGVGAAATNFLYLKADGGTSTTTNGASVTTWSDQSGNGNDATSSGNPPTYLLGQLNGLPSVSFIPNNTLSAPSVFPTNTDYTKLVVGRVTDVSATNNFFSGSSVHALYLGGGLEPKLYHNADFVTSSVAMTANTFAIITGTFTNATLLGAIYVNGTPGGSGIAGIPNTDATINLGSYGGTNFLAGDMTEVIAYNFSLNTTERTIVENYLSAKYNLTISNSAYSFATTHPNEVVGIGRTSVTDSHLSARSAKILDISEPAVGSFSDGDYLMSGHDGASVAAWTTTETPAGSPNIQRLSREWKMTNTGTVGSVTLGIDNSLLPALPGGYTKYVIMVDADGDFTTGALVYEIPLVSGTSYARTGIAISNGNYIAIGTVIPTIQFVSASEAAFENTSLPVAVSLNYNNATAVTVNFISTPGTAADPADYTISTVSPLNLPANSGTANIVPTIVDDALAENDENFTLTISSPSAGITLGATTVNTYTIHDDDETRTIAFVATSSNASESVTSVSITISDNMVDVSNPTTVDYSVTGGTATGSGVDYTLASGTATIVANTTSTTLNFTIVDDLITEPDETIIISLTNPVNANLGVNTIYTYTINDNDGPVATFTTATFSGLESVATVNFPVSLSSTSSLVTSLAYTVTGTATGGGVDYTLADGTLTIPAGNTSANITATVVNDNLPESSETIIVTLSSPVNCTLGATTITTYTILDDDPFGWTGPGGVGGPLSNLLWLRADLGTSTTTDGVNISSWADQSGTATDASQSSPGSQPVYKASQLNGLPTVRFDGSASFLNCPSVFPINSDYAKFAVMMLATTSGSNNVISGSGTHALFFGGTAEAQLFHQGTFVTSSIDVTVGEFAVVTGTYLNATGFGQLYIDGASGGTGTTSTANSDNTLQIGAFAGGNLLTGDIAEAIVYNMAINSARRVIVENYLASKYNLTIANDMYAFDATHGNEVAGIGRDDANNLHDDAQGSGLVRINTPSSLGDGDYLLWGHNGAALTSNNTVDKPPGFVSRMNRVWRTQQTVDVGTVTISFDLTGLTVSSGTDIALLTDADGVFAAGATAVTTGSTYNSTTHIISFSPVSLPSGLYFTLGSTTSATTLPVRLLDFTASADRVNKSVHVAWRTATETNNDYFSVERSTDGQEWEQIEKVEGAGTSVIAHTYTIDDKNPMEGESYYRLGQTDFSGRKSLYDMVAVDFNQEDFLDCYPNPANQSITISTRDPANVSILTSGGRLIFSNFINQPFSLSTQDLPEGFYIVKSSDRGKVVTKKMVIFHK